MVDGCAAGEGFPEEQGSVVERLSVWRTTHGALDSSNSLGQSVDGPKARAAGKQVAVCCQVSKVACSKDSMFVHIQGSVIKSQGQQKL